MNEEPGIYRDQLPTDGHFTTVRNSWIRSTDLSPQANFLWIYLLSHKVGYELRDTQILTETGFGPKGLRAARSELEDAGWLVLRRKKNPDGSLGTYAYHLQEPRVPQGTVEQSTVEQGTVPEGPDYKKTISKKTISKKTNKRALSDVPEDFAPNETTLNNPKYAGVDMAHEVERFINWHQAKGVQNKDWQAAFRNWLNKGLDYRAQRDYRESDREQSRRELDAWIAEQMEKGEEE